MHVVSTRRLLILLAAISLLFAASAAVVRFVEQDQHTAEPSGVVNTPPPQPSATPADKVEAQSPKGFQRLISYTDRGFEPRSATIKVGDTVRFTNNSSTDIWIAAGGPKIYPARADACGSSALDSCAPVMPGRYWEFTFAEKGTWGIVNNLDKSKSANVRVD